MTHRKDRGEEKRARKEKYVYMFVDIMLQHPCTGQSSKGILDPTPDSFRAK